MPIWIGRAWKKVSEKSPVCWNWKTVMSGYMMMKAKTWRAVCMSLWNVLVICQYSIWLPLLHSILVLTFSYITIFQITWDERVVDTRGIHFPHATFKCWSCFPYREDTDSTLARFIPFGRMMRARRGHMRTALLIVWLRSLVKAGNFSTQDCLFLSE